MPHTLPRVLIVPLLVGAAGCLSVDQRDALQDDRAIDPSARQVGAWYSTWYTNRGRYLWSIGNGVGSGQQLLGDVDGDGRADATVFFAQDGSWYVGRSNGDGLGGFVRSPVRFGADATQRWLADVDGDGRADAVTYRADVGRWVVAPGQSSGVIGAPATWIEGHGVGSSHQFLADVDGDGRSDAVVFFAGWDGGRWYVSRSTGQAFGSFELLRSGFGGGTPRMGDVDGDGRDDAVMITADGRWRAAYSNGAQLHGDVTLAQGHGSGAAEWMLADSDGDGRDDLIAYFPQLHGGALYAARTQARNVAALVPSVHHPWKVGAGSLHYSADQPGVSPAFSWVGLADLTGDGQTDAVGYQGHDGSWRVVPGQYASGLEVNSWEYWDMGYRPLVGGSAGYDSSDPALVDTHLHMLADAEIDFVIVDLTNNVGAQPMLDGATNLCRRISAWNSVPGHRPVRYSIAVGGLQFSSDPLSVEQEAQFVRQHFVDDATCGGDNYYRHQGRPMLTSYSSWEQRQAWEQWPGDKSASSAFSVMFADGAVPRLGGAPIPPAYYPQYVGWGMPEGALPNSEVMVVMPGWNNHLGAFVSRTLDGDPAGFFVERGWERVLAAKPKMVVINSFNEFAEQTGIEPADTSRQRAGEEAWVSAGLYWELTRDYISLYRQR